jgi:hypothetical protein
VVKKRWRRCSVRATLERREGERGEVRWRTTELSLYIGVEGEKRPVINGGRNGLI